MIPKFLRPEVVPIVEVVIVPPPPDTPVVPVVNVVIVPASKPTGGVQ